MKTVNFTTKRLIFPALVLSILGGCAVYSPTPAYYVPGDAQVYVAPPPVYRAPPVYASPWYVGPPLFFNFGFSSGHYGGYRGWHGGGWGHGGGHFHHGR